MVEMEEERGDKNAYHDTADFQELSRNMNEDQVSQLSLRNAILGGPEECC